VITDDAPGAKLFYCMRKGEPWLQTVSKTATYTTPPLGDRTCENLVQRIVNLA
jgi:hypothetical protein